MYKMVFAFFFISLSANATNLDFIFKCKTNENDLIKLYKQDDKMIIDIDNKKIQSQDSYQKIVSEISSSMSVSNDYLEFRANEYYISVGNENTQEEANGHNEKEIVRISTLLSDHSGEKYTKVYKCTDEYQNNISDLSLE